MRFNATCYGNPLWKYLRKLVKFPPEEFHPRKDCSLLAPKKTL